MTVLPARWGVPDSGSTIARRRLIEAIAASNERIKLLVAPSGYGKTLAAAQYAQSLQQDVVWLSLGAQHVDYDSLVRQVGQAVGCLRSSREQSVVQPLDELQEVVDIRGLLSALNSAPVALFLDDLRIMSPSDTTLLMTLVEALGPFLSQLVVTMRELNASDLESRHSAVFDRRDLAFDFTEAHSMAQELCGEEVDQAHSESLAKSCAGHPALLRMALCQSAEPYHDFYSEPAAAASVLVERLVAAHLGRDEREILEAASLLKDGAVGDLEAVGLPNARRGLETICRYLPLVSLFHQGQSRQLSFVVHDLVGECIVHGMARQQGREIALDRVLAVLAARGNWARAVDLIRLHGDDGLAMDFLQVHGKRMLEQHEVDEALGLLNSVPLQEVMGHPKCLLYWSQALVEVGEVEESIAKAAAAIHLALHEQDYDTLGLAVSQRVQAMLDRGKAEEAIEAAEQTLRGSLALMRPSVKYDLLVSYSMALLVADRRQDAQQALVAAEEAALESKSRSATMISRLHRIRAYLRPCWEGDFAGGIRDTSLLLDDPNATLLDRQSVRGNLAWMLLEVGRLDRAQALITPLLESNHALLRAAYIPVAGLILAARGDIDGAIDVLTQSHAAAEEYRDEADPHVNRLYQSCIERAGGRLEASLDSAERSFERLSRQDFIGCSRLATAEVAASLLALGDSSAARAWLGEEVQRWQQLNRYHALAGAMVLAVADSRDGNRQSGISRITPFADYIRSDSANWRMAMYCRSFPELLGLLAASVGPQNLPMHMLKMVLPEYAERGLREARPAIPKTEWQLLGERVLGSDQFTSFVERNGKPICRVRLFGGLDVLIDDRAVRERDWKKRKARLLFAMLVVRQGQDVPRDQILEYLWPDLDEGKAKNNFYVAWSTMKSALVPAALRDDGCPYVESSRGRCRVIRESVRSDVDEFDELLSTAREAEASDKPKDALAALHRLAALYRGDLLPGDVYDDWFAPFREKYRFDFIEAMLRGADMLVAADDPCEALVFVRRALTVDPYREDLYQLALRCHLLAGQRSAAIETFIQCKTQLAEELGLDPSSDTMRLYQEILAMEERPRFDSYGLQD